MRPVIRRDDRDKVHRHHQVHARCRCPKLAYTSRKRAKAAAAAQTRNTGELITAYHCGSGHCWHIGHPPGTRGEVVGRGADARLAS